MIKSSRESGGFTLLEVLVAIVLLALLTTVLLAGFRFETRAFYRQSARLDRSGKIPVVFAFLRSHLADARPVLPINSTGTTIVFDGRAADVAFVGTAPQSVQGGGLYLFKVDFTKGQLRVRWRLFEGILPAADAGGEDTLLLDGVGSVRLKYYGTLDAVSSPAWNDQWRGTSVLPSAVRLELAFADGEHPPALIVAPRLRPLEVPVPTTLPVSAIPR